MAPHVEPRNVSSPTASKKRMKKFRAIVSPLDPADSRSGVHTSEFRGMYNLAMLSGVLYTFTTLFTNLMTRKEPADMKLLLSVFYSTHLLEVFVTFACQALYAYTALIPVYMAGTKMLSGRLLINIVHHTLQSLLFFFTVVCIVWRDWNLIHAVSAFIEGLVLLMKMHSYIRTKLEISRREGKAPSPDVKDYTMYLLIPSLVYEPNFPRTNRIRWGYVAEKTFSVILGISTLYIIVTNHVMPRLEDSGTVSPALSIVSLLLPFLGCYLLTWFIIFECICNGFAEVTYLADRDFYSDWWNSTTFDEFARKWNKPVHEFLLRHVYLESRDSYNISKINATVFTFFMSAALHECVFILMFRAVKMYFFMLQMVQVVIIVYGRGLRGTRLGNLSFWFGMILGLPLQAVIYSREYHGGEPIFMVIMMPAMIFGFGGMLRNDETRVTMRSPTESEKRMKKFQAIVSPLDPGDARSNVHTSDLRGIYNLGLLCSALYTFTMIFTGLVTREEPGDMKFLLSIFYSTQLLEVLVIFACQALYSYTALIPVYMAGIEILSGRQLINTVHHTLQSLLFFFTVVCIVWRDWNLIHAVSAFLEGVVLMMKMHSYIRTKLETSRREGKPPSSDVKDFTVYLLMPTLVYEPSFPRTNRIRWGYVVTKLSSIVLGITMLFIILLNHVMPRLEASGTENPLLSVVSLLLRFLTCYLLVWFVIFECICNGLAEVTYLADRDFYSDWWNSTTFDEFARKWNKPVHEFLLRHVYLDTQQNLHISKCSATVLTFLLSSVLHECVFVIMFRTVKMYFFVLQMMQVVLIIYGRGVRGTRLGNAIFWLGLIVSLPLEAIIYCREYHGGEPIFMVIMMPVLTLGFCGICVSSLLYINQPKGKQQ
ncbi:hypothetical protein BBJ29_001448 [Phytophthora kernoviae]|uniref:O-acyltransferase n=1 Tax=Phytophthora kernoviae TaxID=325452 RepID=A0A3F2S246_9STRA|nr:hypothetical protein BBP00_00001266 [Phytophthora kernoviae]RLN69829.1 hypothetical protein BBJ29_001448 [Phytophthora kernoviae]